MTPAQKLWQSAKTMQQDALDLEGRAVRMALEDASWLVERAAKLLEVAPSTLRRAIERHNLHWEILQRRIVGAEGGRPRNIEENPRTRAGSPHSEAEGSVR